MSHPAAPHCRRHRLQGSFDWNKIVLTASGVDVLFTGSYKRLCGIFGGAVWYFGLTIPASQNEDQKAA